MPHDGRPRADEYQPPLTWWDHTWRTLVMLILSGLGWVAIGALPSLWWVVANAFLGVATFGMVLMFRRRWPLHVALLTTVLTAISPTATGPSTLALISLATQRNWRHLMAAGTVAIVGAEISMLVNPETQLDPRWLGTILNIVTIAAFIGWGMYIGSRRELLWALRRRAKVAEAERDLRVRQSRLEERARIAREMHDVLAHRISQVALHAGALSYRTSLNLEEVREGTSVIRDAAHQALGDLRDVLGVLRDSPHDVALSPQPTYEDVAALIAEARQSGLRIVFSDAIKISESVPDTTGRTIYRIVQEGITNARKHAPGADITVDLMGGPDQGITVTVTNPIGFGPAFTPRSGYGLIGLAERARLHGGTLEHGPVKGDFAVKAWFLWHP